MRYPKGFPKVGHYTAMKRRGLLPKEPINLKGEIPPNKKDDDTETGKKIKIIVIVFVTVFIGYKILVSVLPTDADAHAKLIRIGMPLDKIENILGKSSGSHYYSLSRTEHIWWIYEDGSRLYLKFDIIGGESLLRDVEVEKQSAY